MTRGQIVLITNDAVYTAGEYDGRDIHDCVDRIKIKIAYYNLEYKVYPGEILFVKDLTDMSINKYRCTKIDEDYIYLKEDIE